MSVSQAGMFSLQEFADAGAPLALGRLYTLAYGTTTQKTVYTDAAGTTPHTYTSDGAGGSYIALNARGELPAPLYLASGPYDIALKRADGSTVWTRRADGIGADQSVANPRMYPWLAVGDGIADDTIALNAFLAAVTRGRIPAGTYKITGPLNFQSNQVITGDGPSTVIKYAATAPAANSPVLNFATKSHTRVSDFAMQVPASTYTTARSIFMDTCTDVKVERIIYTNGAGGNAAYLTACIGCAVKSCWVDDYRSNGFYVTNGTNNIIEDNDIPNGAGGQMGILLDGGDGNVARFNRVALTPDAFFGIQMLGGNFPVAQGNFIKNTRREALTFGGSTQIGAKVINNTFYWDANLGTGDFGMSITGANLSNFVTDWLVDGNMIVNSALSGIGVAGFAQRGKIVNNTLRDCCYAGSAGFQGAIKLYGWVAGAVVSDITVEGNSVYKLNGGMTTVITEDQALGSVGANVIRGNKSSGLAAIELYPLSSSTSIRVLNDMELAGISSTATPTSGTGAITTASGTLIYQRVGKFMVCRLSITITTNGTGATSLIFPLPFTATGGALTGEEAAVSHKSLKATASGGGTTLTITNYDNTYPGASGAALSLSGILQVA